MLLRITCNLVHSLPYTVLLVYVYSAEKKSPEQESTDANF